MGTTTTHRRDFAADLLQVAGHAMFDSIPDCGRPPPMGSEDGGGGLGPSIHTEATPVWKNPSPPFRGEREGPARREGEVGGAAYRFVGPPHPALSPRPAGGRG